MNKYKLTIVLDNIRSAYNVGAMLRSADGLGKVCEVYMCGITPTPQNDKVAKTALGADKSIKWKYFENTVEALNILSTPVYVLEITNDSEPYYKINYPKDMAIVVGHEVRGVNIAVMPKRSNYIYIPMHGIKGSLNVSTALSIVMYHIAVQWNIL